jgi:hypothetical protein
MKPHRFIHLAIFAAFLWLGQQQGFGDDAAKVDHFDIPVQNYAPLDISGTVAGDNSVSLVALDDDNKAAFAYQTGTGDSGHCYAKKWIQGVLSDAEDFSLQIEDSFDMSQMLNGGNASGTRNFYPGRILPNGTLYGWWDAEVQYQSQDYYIQGGTFRATNNTCNILDAPEPYTVGNSIDWSYPFSYATINGYCGAVDDAWRYNQAYGSRYFIAQGDNFTVFDSNPPDDVPDSINVIQHNFSPYFLNKNGCAIGWGDGGDKFWNGNELNDLSDLNTSVALNDSNDIIVNGTWNTSTQRNEGAFLVEQGETGSKEYFLKNGNDPGLIPTKLQSQVRNIQPFLISNRLANATGTQPVLHILFVADTRRSTATDTWESATFLLRKLADGTTDLQEITGLDSYRLVSVNQYGILAALADPDGSTGPTAVNHAMLLVPASISIKKQGDNAPPTDGVIVKKGDTLTINLNGNNQSSTALFAGQPAWKYQQLKPDGTYTDWQAFGTGGTGSQFDYITTTSGIFQVEVVFFGDDAKAVKYVRKKDELKTSNGYMGPGRKGAPDSFGVCDTQKQIDIRNEAKRYLGSPAYASNMLVPAEYGFAAYLAIPTGIRCNIFVAHRCCAVGATVPAINYGLGLTSGNPGLNSYPPSANQWAGIESTSHIPLNFTTVITGWPLLSTDTFPQPGFVIAHPDSGDAGHCAIIDYDGASIGAGVSGTVNKNYLNFWDGTSRLRQYQP